MEDEKVQLLCGREGDLESEVTVRVCPAPPGGPPSRWKTLQTRSGTRQVSKLLFPVRRIFCFRDDHEQAETG